MGTLVKWAIFGGIIGFFIGIKLGDISIGIIGGAIFAVSIRKAIFRNFWL